MYQSFLWLNSWSLHIQCPSAILKVWAMTAKQQRRHFEKTFTGDITPQKDRNGICLVKIDFLDLENQKLRLRGQAGRAPERQRRSSQEAGIELPLLWNSSQKAGIEAPAPQGSLAFKCFLKGARLQQHLCWKIRTFRNNFTQNLAQKCSPRVVACRPPHWSVAFYQEA